MNNPNNQGVLNTTHGEPHDSRRTPRSAVRRDRPPTPAKTVDVYLVRHGRTWLNQLNRVQGWADTPLTTEGERLARLLGTRLAEAGISFDKAYSADMVRHYTTAHLILEGMDDPGDVTRLFGLREMAFGGFEGGDNDEMWAASLAAIGVSSREDLEARGLTFLDLVEGIDRANPDRQFPTESAEAVGQRGLRALQQIVHDQHSPHSAVVAVSSGVTISCILGQLRECIADCWYPQWFSQPAALHRWAVACFDG